MNYFLTFAHWSNFCSIFVSNVWDFRNPIEIALSEVNESSFVINFSFQNSAVELKATAKKRKGLTRFVSANITMG